MKPSPNISNHPSGQADFDLGWIWFGATLIRGSEQMYAVGSAAWTFNNFESSSLWSFQFPGRWLSKIAILRSNSTIHSGIDLPVPLIPFQWIWTDLSTSGVKFGSFGAQYVAWRPLSGLDELDYQTRLLVHWSLTWSVFPFKWRIVISRTYHFTFQFFNISSST